VCATGNGKDYLRTKRGVKNVNKNRDLGRHFGSYSPHFHRQSTDLSTRKRADERQRHVAVLLQTATSALAIRYNATLMPPSITSNCPVM
jgi:hypothetical protein